MVSREVKTLWEMGWRDISNMALDFERTIEVVSESNMMLFWKKTVKNIEFRSTADASAAYKKLIEYQSEFSSLESIQNK